eukprot:5357880-Amphidinium_carterae.1
MAPLVRLERFPSSSFPCFGLGLLPLPSLIRKYFAQTSVSGVNFTHEAAFVTQQLTPGCGVCAIVTQTKESRMRVWWLFQNKTTPAYEQPNC